ncbi:fatty acyl-AMP ligase [Nonomuraea sp. NPDC050328]|uniref:fatty acyl-AMP ligase n=1 Tax=Nonomuraea sp. NPDC050328 TaxID=3364361 RepID=UPI0037B8A74C
MASGKSLMTLCSAIRSHALHHPKRPAVGFVRDPGDPSTARWWTYTDLDREAQSVAAYLRTHAEAGARVLLTYASSGEFVVGLLGCLYANLIAIPSSLPGQYAHSRRRVLNIARDAGFSFVLAGSSVIDEVHSWADEHLPGTTILDHAAAVVHPGRYFDSDAIDPATVAILQYTSGSTGSPKGSVVTHGNLRANASAILTAFSIDQSDRFGGWIPNYHDMGIGIILPPLLAGASTVLMDPATFLRRPSSWLKLISTYGVTFTAAPNFGYRLCTRRVTEAEVSGLDLSSLRHAINGSEPVDARVVREFTERFAPARLRQEAIVPSYGMAEATVFIAGTPDRTPVVFRCAGDALADDHLVPSESGAPHRELVSCGHPQDLEIRIVSPSGQELADGQIGEIWLRGPSIVAGYWNNTEANARSFDARIGDEGGFLRTGDLGALVDGELYVTGRIKEMIIVRGRNIYPHDVEQEVRLHHDQLRDGCGAAITIPGETGDERLILVHEVVGRASPEELAATSRSIRETVVREFGVRCDQVVLVRRGAVRRTTSGKIERAEMRRAYLAGELHSLVDDAVQADSPATAGR